MRRKQKHTYNKPLDIESSMRTLANTLIDRVLDRNDTRGEKRVG
jgi:hypothetical protein